MIDFRYHLVSLVSVFMALAIGVVLGAGPLRDSIGDTLTSQVDLLREDRAALQLENSDLRAQVAARDAALEELAPVLADGALTGTSTVVVALPGADGGLVDDLEEQVVAAGGEVTGTVELDPAWVDPDAAATREDVLAALPDLALNGVEGDAGTPDALAGALAAAVVAGDDGLVGSASAAGSQVIEALTAADLADVEGEPSLRAGTALVVAPAAGAAPTGSAEVDDARAATDLAVLGALGSTGAGTVLAGLAPGDGTTGDEAPDAVALLRGEALADDVSAVDDAGTPAGRLGVVLALRQQADGGAGQYGSRDGAEAALPPLPPDDAGTAGTTTGEPTTGGGAG